MSAMSVRTLLVGIVVTLSALPAAAQNGAISGRVTEAGSDRGIASAGVRVLAGIRNAGGAPTDENGNYRITNVPPGTYTVEARRVGFSSTFFLRDVRLFRGLPLTRKFDPSTIPAQPDWRTCSGACRRRPVCFIRAPIRMMRTPPSWHGPRAVTMRAWRICR